MVRTGLFILLVLIIALLMSRYVIERVRVHNHSMEHTLEPDDIVLIDKISYRFRDPKRFDIIVFKQKGSREELIKRVIGLPFETVQITDRINLIGRKDRSVPERLSAAQLMENLDPSCYNILLDHQPHDFNNEAEAGFDLVLCGHTHGGQMFPVGITGELSGANDKTYGLEQRKDTVFIVNSGISDWAFKFKTATRSEFGVIDIQSAPEKSDKSVKSQ